MPRLALWVFCIGLGDQVAFDVQRSNIPVSQVSVADGCGLASAKSQRPPIRATLKRRGHLTKTEVLEIERCWVGGQPLTALAARFDVGVPTLKSQLTKRGYHQPANKYDAAKSGLTEYQQGFQQGAVAALKKYAKLGRLSKDELVALARDL
jgi:hypothetical protein